MKAHSLYLALACTLVLSGAPVRAQDAAPAPPAKEKPKPDQKALEEKFTKTMTKATLNGRFTAIKDGKMGPERSEKYTVDRVTKLAEDNWFIFARIQYGEKDVTVPVPVQVKWAGDTPVITLTDVGIPGLGTYSARVLVYENTYAGTWSGGGHGGLMSGVIEHPNP